MVREIARFACGICGREYEDRAAAELCESFPLASAPIAVGATARLRHRDGSVVEATVTALQPMHPAVMIFVRDAAAETRQILERMRDEGGHEHEWSLVLDREVQLDWKWDGYYRDVAASYLVTSDEGASTGALRKS